MSAVAFVQESLQEFSLRFLGDFTPSSLEVGEARQSESGVQLVCGWIERSLAARLQLHSRVENSLLSVVVVVFHPDGNGRKRGQQETRWGHGVRAPVAGVRKTRALRPLSEIKMATARSRWDGVLRELSSIGRRGVT